MGQKPKSPQSITLSKTVTISIKYQKKNYPNAIWSKMLGEYRRGKNGNADDIFHEFFSEEGDMVHELFMESIEKVKVTYNTHKQPNILL